MKLYEIDEAIMNLIDEETGEILDYEQFSNLQMQREAKLEGVACYIKQLDYEIQALKDEEDKMKKRRKIKENSIKNLKTWLSAVLEGKKFETPKCKVSFRKTTSVVVDDEIFLKQHKDLCDEDITYKYDKIKLKKLLQSGTKLTGTMLFEKKSMIIK